MFSDKDFNKIEEALESRLQNKLIKRKVSQSKLKSVKSQLDQSMLYLESILYLSRNNWAAWVSGNKINFRK